MDVYIQNTTAREDNEDGAVLTAYIDPDSDMAQDYSISTLFKLPGSGESAFWLRAKATAATLEEFKWINVRL